MGNGGEGFSDALATAMSTGLAPTAQAESQALGQETQEVLPSIWQPSTKLTEAEAQVLLEVEELIEGMGQEFAFPLLELLQALEYQGPSGIRVHSAGYKAAAITDQAEIFWQGLLTTVQNGVAESADGGEVSSSVDGSSGADLGDAGQALVLAWLQEFLVQVTPLVSRKSESPIAGQVIGSTGVEDFAQNAGGELRTTLSEAGFVGEGPEGELVESPLKPSVEAVSGFELFSEHDSSQAVFPPAAPMSAEPLVVPDEKSRSAVVVLTPAEDRLRASVLRAFAKQSERWQQPTAAAVGNQALGGAERSVEQPSWLQWLRQQVQSVEEVVTRWESVAEKSLSFLQFVQRKRQQPLGFSANQELQVVKGESPEVSVDETDLSERKGSGLLERRPRSGGQVGSPYRDFSPLKASSSVEPVLQQEFDSDALDPLLSSSRQSQPIQKSLELSESSLGNSPAPQKDVFEAQMPIQKDEALTLNKLTNANASPSTTQVSRWTVEQVQQVMAQVKEHMQLWVDRKLVAMEFQLEPADLGRMSMKTVLEQGRIGVLFQVESAAVKELMQQQAQQLREVLESQGLEVAGLHVEVSDREEKDAQHGRKKGTGTEFDMDKLLSEEEGLGQNLAVPKVGLIDSRA